MSNRSGTKILKETWAELVALVFFISLLWFQERITHAAATGSLDPTQVYALVLAIMAVLSGALFSIYGNILPRQTDGFIDVIRNTSAYQRFLRNLRQGITAGMASSLMTAPLMATNYTLGNMSGFFVFFAFWFSLSLFGFIKFVAVARDFDVLISTKDRTSLPANHHTLRS